MAPSERHAWVEFYGSWHCFGCRATVHEKPLAEGCVSISVRLRSVAEHPQRYGSRHISELMIEAADRLSADAYHGKTPVEKGE